MNLLKRKYNYLAIMILMLTMSFNTLFSTMSYADIDKDKLDDVVDIVQHFYIEDVSDGQIENAALQGILSSLDLYSNYYTADEYKMEIENSSGTFAGVGISMTKDEATGYIYVEEAHKEMPAYQAGVRTGDFIISVDGKAVKEMSLKDAGDIIRGEVGEAVVFGVLRGSSDKVMDIKVVRQIVSFSSVEVQWLQDDQIIYIRIDEFNDGVADDLKKDLLNMMSNHPEAKGLVIDLRDNPGGYVDEAVAIADIFLPDGAPIYHSKFKNEPIETEYAKQPAIWNDVVAVLINNDSASASELLTGALQDVEMAKVFGEKSYGKGIMQATLPLDDGDAVEFTVAEYFTANHHKVHKVGITPDVIVKQNMPLSIEHFAPIIQNKEYKKGEIGLNVYAVQQRLMTLGYNVKTTATLDDETIKAVHKFAKDYNLTYNTDVLTAKFSKQIDEIATKIAQYPVDNVLYEAIDWLLTNK